MTLLLPLLLLALLWVPDASEAQNAPLSQIQQEEPRVRARALGVTLGDFPPGKLNAITDVAGVRVGHVT